MFRYLLGSLVSKEGKTEIGDTLFRKEKFPLDSIPAFFVTLPL
jgi:peptide subunit release factor RF-3